MLENSWIKALKTNYPYGPMTWHVGPMSTTHWHSCKCWSNQIPTCI